jgi:transcriptional/translational regulatory protein YebC/TACO1
MSGHNKWSKIKYKKAATDAVRSRIFSKHSRYITMESRRCLGDTNSPALIAVIERAKKDSMPKDNIDRAVAKGKDTNSAKLEEIMFEGFGPGGSAILIMVVTDNNFRTAPEIKHIFTKAGYSIGSPGSAVWAFTKNQDHYSPISPLSLNDEDGEALANLIESLEEHDDVQEVFTTADEAVL